MADLTKLTIPDLKQLTKVLGWTTRKRSVITIIKEIKDKKVPNAKIEQAIVQMHSMPKSSKESDVSTKSVPYLPSKNKLQTIETRLSQLEKQVRFIMNKLSIMEIRMAGPVEALESTKIQPLKKLILRLIPQGTVISTDEIRNKKDLQHYQPKDIERALLELVDEECFDVAEGQSQWTLSGNIGLLIRR